MKMRTEVFEQRPCWCVVSDWCSSISNAVVLVRVSQRHRSCLVLRSLVRRKLAFCFVEPSLRIVCDELVDQATAVEGHRDQMLGM
jgi:hypothetical protein